MWGWRGVKLQSFYQNTPYELVTAQSDTGGKSVKLLNLSQGELGSDSDLVHGLPPWTLFPIIHCHRA